MSDRERERAMRQAERQRERLERQAEREREMAERQRERLERQAERERERLERQAERERERLRSGRGKGRIASVPLAEGTCTQATTMAIIMDTMATIMDTMATIMDTNLRKCHSLCLLLGVGRRPFSLESTTKGNRTNSKVASWTRSVRAILRARTLSLSFG